MTFIDPAAMEHLGLPSYHRASGGQSAYSGFFSDEYMNFGYWNSDTKDRSQASDELLRKLVAPMENRDVHVLDVACGTGSTTAFLSRHWAPDRVRGVDISEALIARCREHHPSCHFSVMNATALDFAAATFDYVVCVEAAFHFSKSAFFGEALRVLKTGGILALTDFADSLDDYRNLLLTSGFPDVTVRDITANGRDAYLRFIRQKLRRDCESGLVRNNDELDDASRFLNFVEGLRQRHVMVFAHKR